MIWRLNKKFWKYKFSSEKRTTANEENCQMAIAQGGNVVGF